MNQLLAGGVAPDLRSELRPFVTSQRVDSNHFLYILLHLKEKKTEVERWSLWLPRVLLLNAKTLSFGDIGENNVAAWFFKTQKLVLMW